MTPTTNSRPETTARTPATTTITTAAATSSTTTTSSRTAKGRPKGSIRTHTHRSTPTTERTTTTTIPTTTLDSRRLAQTLVESFLLTFLDSVTLFLTATPNSLGLVFHHRFRLFAAEGRRWSICRRNTSGGLAILQ
jgi:hypothetical protein